MDEKLVVLIIDEYKTDENLMGWKNRRKRGNGKRRKTGINK